ncbi:MAG: hypothetical protein RIS08_952 [Actinomycetota bacterium]|jgi:hypothetical protein
MGWLNFLLIAAAMYVLSLAGYRLWLALKTLRAEVSGLNGKLAEFGPDEVVIQPASPVFAEDLPRLLSQRRAMEKRKAQEREERRRRLVARISSINIDRR